MKIAVKRCSVCSTEKPLTDFGKDRSRQSGVNYRCKSCENESQRRRYQTPEGKAKRKASDRRYKLIHRRRIALRDKYGITEEQYEGMLDDQGGVCAICHRPPASNLLSVDHDHDTGRVRGLLCAACNTGIGQFGDDPGLVRRALNYLEAACASQ